MVVKLSRWCTLWLVASASACDVARLPFHSLGEGRGSAAAAAAVTTPVARWNKHQHLNLCTKYKAYISMPEWDFEAAGVCMCMCGSHDSILRVCASTSSLSLSIMHLVHHKKTSGNPMVHTRRLAACTPPENKRFKDPRRQRKLFYAGGTFIACTMNQHAPRQLWN
jgi:hypothetical protein